MAMDLAPWLAQPIANPAAAFAQGFGQGAQVGAHQAEQKIRQQQMNQQAQQHAVELQQRAIEFSMKLEQQQQELEMQKQRQADIYELESGKLQEEAARTAMYGQWHQGDIARRTAADQLAAGEVAAFKADEAAGIPTALLARKYPKQMAGAVQLQISDAKMAQEPSIKTLPGSQGPIDVLTQPGTAPRVVPPKTTPRDPTYAARLTGYKTQMANLVERMKRHPSRIDAQLSDEEIAKTKGISKEGVAEFRALKQQLDDVSAAFAKFRDSGGAAQAQAKANRTWNPETSSWIDPGQDDIPEEDPEDLGQ